MAAEGIIIMERDQPSPGRRNGTGMAGPGLERKHGMSMGSDNDSRGTRLRMFRKEKGMTLKRLADETGLSVGFLSKIENGIGNPSVDSIQSICYALDITANDLMNDKKKEERLSTINEGHSFEVKKADRCLLYDFAGNVRLESIFEGNPHFKVNALTLEQNTPHIMYAGRTYDEFVIVARGTLQVNLNDAGDQAAKEHILHEGDAMLIHADTAYSLSNMSEDLCISYWVVTEKS